MEHQVQNAPKPTKISAMPSEKYYWKMSIRVPKTVQRFPQSEMRYQALKSLIFSKKLKEAKVVFRLS